MDAAQTEDEFVLKPTSYIELPGAEGEEVSTYLPHYRVAGTPQQLMRDVALAAAADGRFLRVWRVKFLRYDGPTVSPGRKRVYDPVGSEMYIQIAHIVTIAPADPVLVPQRAV